MRFISGWFGAWLRALNWRNWRIPMEKMNAKNTSRTQAVGHRCTLNKAHISTERADDQTEPIERGRVKHQSSKLVQSEVCVLTNEPLSPLTHTPHTHICRLRQNEPINTSYSARVYGCLWPFGLLTILNKQVRTCKSGRVGLIDVLGREGLRTVICETSMCKVCVIAPVTIWDKQLDMQ